MPNQNQTAPASKDPKRGLTRLHDLEPAEISLVPSGANRRRILVMKNAEGRVEIVAKGGPGSGPVAVSKGGPNSGPPRGGDSSKVHPDTNHHPEHDQGELHPTLDSHGFKYKGSNLILHGPTDRSVRHNYENGTGHQVSATASDKGGGWQWTASQGGHKIKSGKTSKGLDHYLRNRAPGTVSKSLEDTVAADPSTKLKNMIAKTDPKVLESVDQCMKSYFGKPADKSAVKKAAGETDEAGDAAEGEEVTLDPQVVAAGRAVVRILSPFKGRLPAALAHQLVGLSGLGDDDDDPEGENDDDDGAMNIGDGEQVEKSGEDDEEKKEKRTMVMGVRGNKSKDGKVSKAAGYDDEGDDSDEDDAENEEVSKLGNRDSSDAEMAMKRDGSTVEKSKGERVSKSANELNDAPDLSGVDPKTRAAVELVMKSQRELVAKNAELTKESADLRSQMRQKELVQKAAAWGHLGIPQEDIVAQLNDADKAGKEAFERVEKSFTALNNQAKAGGLFNEIGSGLPQGGNAPDGQWAKIEAAASGWAQKSGEKCTKAEATDKFLQTPEGQKMYGDYKAGRTGGI